MKVYQWALIASACMGYADVHAQNSQAVASADPGKMVYEQNCLACHQADGSGVPHLAPALIEGTFVSGDKKKLIDIVLKGMQGVEIKGQYYANPMPAFDYLSDADIANVLTFVRSNFKNKAEPITESDVKEARNTK